MLDADDRLLAAWQAWHDDPDDEALEGSYRQAAAEARQGPALNPGEIVADRYRLQDHRGNGPLAATWAATDLPSGDRVLVKTLHARFLHDRELVARFHRSIARQAEVAERGIAPIVGTGEPWSGFHWAVTGWFPKQLDDVLEDLDDVGARQLLLDIATALGNAHAAGLAHGRVAPEAVVLHADGAAALADFGLQPPASVDSPFAAPESADPRHTPTPAADRYGFAMLVGYVTARGELPYWAGRDPERFVAGLDLDDAMREGLVASIHWDPEERPEGVGDLVRALRGDSEQVRTLVERARDADRPEAALEHLRHLLAVSGGDPDIRVELAQTLSQAGRDRQAIDQLYAAIRAARLRDVELALSELRRLVERTGETGPLIDALERRADEAGAQRDVILLEVARLRARAGEGDPTEAWQSALAAHTRRDQAVVALWALCELAAQSDDWPTFVARGAELASYLDQVAPIARRLGKAFHEHLDDPHAALVWLERARDAGDADPELTELIEALRARRGDWPEVLAMLEERIDHTDQPEATLLRAARLARRAAHDTERARALYARLAQLGSHVEEASAWLAAQAGIDGDEDAELHWLRVLLDTDAATPAQQLRAAELARADGDGATADELVEALLRDHPHHVHGHVLAACRARDRAEPEAAAAHVQTLTELLVPASDAGATAWLQRAELAWRSGDRLGSYLVAEEVLRHRPDDPAAHWALSRATLGGALAGDGHHDGGIHDAPGHLGPPEALARLLAEVVHPDALASYADADPLGAPAGREPLELAAATADGLIASSQVETLLDQLEVLEGVDSDAVSLVRRVWARPGPDAIPADRILRWGGGRPSVTRDLLPTPPAPSPWRGTPRSIDALLVAAPRPADDDDIAPPPPALLEATTLVLVAYPGDARQRQLVLQGDEDLTVGSSPDDDLQVSALEPGHARVRRCGAAVYLQSDQGLRLGPRAADEHRLRAGLELDLAGVPLKVTEQPEDMPPAALEPLPPLDALEDEQTMVIERHSSPRPTALFYERAGAEYMVPLVALITELPGGALLQAEDDGWRLLDDSGEERFVVDGDRFAIESTRYNVRRIESITPVPAPRQEETPDGVPTLFVDEGSSMSRVVALRERTTVGRGREMDLKIRGDAKVSRHHATFEVRPDREVVLVDAGSSNGTFVDGAEVVDEVVLRPGQSILIGDTRLEFRLGVATAARVPPLPDPEDELKATRLSPQPRNTVPRPSLAEGRHRVGVVNRALAPLLAAVDAEAGPGAGAAELQLLMASAGRYQPLFEEVEAKTTGLPVLPVLFNVARQPDAEQRTVLTGGLLDLVERATQHLVERVGPDAVDEVLEQVARSDYRKHLRM